MAPKAVKKSKAEEALAFLDNLDHLDAPEAATDAASSTGSVGRPSGEVQQTGAESTAGASSQPGDDEAASADAALAFLEAQIKQKRGPLSVPSTATHSSSRASTPVQLGTGAAASSAKAEPVVAPAPAASGWGWGGASSLWSSATSALQSAHHLAEERINKVRSEGVAGVTGQFDQLNVGGVDIGKLRKDAEQRFAGVAKNIDLEKLEKLRHDLLEHAGSTITNIINTVAPPISEHETIELWFSHPLVGYDGVEGVVYRAWQRILEQTESGELIIVWSEPEIELPADRSLNPTKGWDAAWAAARTEMAALKTREDTNPRGRVAAPNPQVPVTIVPVFLQIQPVLAPLPIAEPSVLLTGGVPKSPPEHLAFIVSLQDPTHKLQFTTVSQPVPGDWLDVPYERSDWVEERLVDVIRTGVEIVAQDYVSTRMALKPSTTLPTPAEPADAPAEAPAATESA